MALRSAFRTARAAAASVSVFRGASTLALSALPRISGRPTPTAVKAAIAAAAAAVTGVTLITAEKDKAFYKKVYDDIADILDDIDYDDGSYGPVLVRLAWHASGTYDKATKTGGSNAASMRFDPESGHGANSGLKIARDLLQKVKAKYPDISYGDLWTLAGVAAVQQLGGPDIPWRAGRVDGTAAVCTPDGRLPDASKKADHIRNVFYRMGFNDQEIVALAGAHALGRCHTDRSGFTGPWTNAPTTFSNEYFRLLIEEKWVEKKWNGPKQFQDAKTGELMMLPADLAFVEDPEFRKYVQLYAKDSGKFFSDFAAAYSKLLELGVPFQAISKPGVIARK